MKKILIFLVLVLVSVQVLAADAEQLQRDRIAGLEKNANAMSEKETSDANKLLGAASIGATTVGGTMYFSGAAEQRADELAENDMRATLATFRCNYGATQNVAGGTKNNPLPGGNTLYKLRPEYIDLAANLKITKEQLGMRPGIESETVFDSASTGLYDDEFVGRAPGAFVSVADALSGDANAAAAWQRQKSDAIDGKQTGAMVAGAGILGGIAGNMLLNTTGKDGKNLFGANVGTERSAQINAEYKQKLNDLVNGLREKVAAAPVARDEKSGEEVDATGRANVAPVAPENPEIVMAQEEVIREIQTVAAAQNPDNETIIRDTLCNVNKCTADGDVVLDGVNFVFNKSDINRSAKNTLAGVANAIKQIQNDPRLSEEIIVQIVGHTDSAGSPVVNNKLSSARAEAVMRELVNNGVAGADIVAFGLGARQPVASNDTSAGRAQNRRVEISVF